MEYWIVYDVASGEELWRGSGSLGTGAFQQLPKGAALIVVPQAVIARPVLDLDALRETLASRVDAEASAVSGRFITATPAQIGIYVLKEVAARTWLLDREASTLMLAPEAQARGMTVEALAAEVVAQADTWTAIAGMIEGVRMGAKARLAAADTLGAIVAAAALDWSAVAAAEQALAANAPSN